VRVLRSFRPAVVAALALLACACQTARPAPAPVAPAETPPLLPPPPPPPRIVQAPAPPPRSCVPRSLAPPPRYPDSDAALKAAAGAADRYQLLAAGRLLRQRRLEELERVVAGCR